MNIIRSTYTIWCMYVVELDVKFSEWCTYQKFSHLVNTSSQWLIDQLVYWNEIHSNWEYFITFEVRLSFIFIGDTFLAQKFRWHNRNWSMNNQHVVFWMFFEWNWDILLKINGDKNITRSERERESVWGTKSGQKWLE